MRKLLFLIVLAVPALTQADIIKCSFTEPFFTTTYSMAQQSLTIEDNLNGRTQVLRNVSFQILGAGHFELWNRHRQVIQRLNLNFTGSDGMSDRAYPYSAQWLTKGHAGGCTSNFLH